MSGRAGKTRFAWIATITFAFAILAAVAVWAFKGEPQTVVHIKAESRSIKFIVSNETTAQIALPAAMLLRVPGGEPECVSGVIAPAARARVRYSSSAQNTLLIAIEPGDDAGTGWFLPDNGAERALSGVTLFAYGPAVGCGEVSAAALPIWGETVIGNTPRVGGAGSDGLGPILLSGEVDVFGVSRFRSHGQATIFPVQTFPLPAGATIRGSARRGEDAILRGAAIYTPGSDFGALDVSLTSEAGRVQINRWGSTEDGEAVDIGPLAQVAGDPGLASIAALLALVLLSISAVSAVLQVYGEAR